MKNIHFPLATLLITLLIGAMSFKISHDTKEMHIESDQVSQEPVEPFHLSIGSRFMTKLTLSELHAAQSIIDIVPKEATASLAHYINSKVALLTPDGEQVVSGKSEALNEGQKELLHKAGISTDFYITSDAKSKQAFTGILEDYHLVYYITVVPEIEATYEPGLEKLLSYLRMGSADMIKKIDIKKLQPGKIRFTVDNNGHLTNSYLESTSGHTMLDLKMVELIEKSPGTWKAARDHDNNTVPQELVFSFGIIGC